MRRVFLLFFLGCSAGTDDVLVPAETPDATTADSPFEDVFLPPIGDVGPPEPVFTGGPVACGTCTCDGTLYACRVGAVSDAGCSGGGGLAPMVDAADDAEADADLAPACSGIQSCVQLPVECLPKATCACITKVTGLMCTIDPNGNGFTITCPPPRP